MTSGTVTKTKEMKRINIIAALLLATCLGISAQEKGEKARGRAIVQIYTNFHSGFGAVNDDRGFALDRSYIGYEYMPGRGLTLKGVLDVGQSSDVNDYQRIAYIKNAFVGWKWRWLTLNGGLIPTTQFNYQENFWGFRYVYNSFQDQYGFGSSADLGISAAYRFAKWIEADVIIANGEGFRRVQVDDGLLYGIGTTITPFRGMSFRLYASINEGSDGAKDIVNYAMFAGYRHRYFSVALEYNIMRNSNRMAGKNLYGFSLYATGTLNRWLDIYARTDGLMSGDDWNEQNDEIEIIAGAQFKLGRYIKIAPNFRMSIPKADSVENRYYGYISCSFGL